MGPLIERYVSQSQGIIMRRLKNLLIILLIIIAGIFYGLYYFEHNQLLEVESKEIITSDIVESRINEISELATVSYRYKDVLQLRDHKEFNGVKIPFSEKSFILVYKGEVKAGIDLSDIEIEVDDSNNVKIICQSSKILTHTIDENSIQVVDENDGFLNELKYEDFFQVISEKKIMMEKELDNEGFLKQGNDQIEKVLQTLLLHGDIETLEVEFIHSVK